MNPERDSGHGGTTPHETKAPLDVRVVAYYLYVIGFVGLALSLLFAVGLARPHEPFSVLLIIPIASRFASSVYMLGMGVFASFCAWGLMRRAKFAWRGTLVLFAHSVTDGALTFSKHPSRGGASLSSLVLGSLCGCGFGRG